MPRFLVWLLVIFISSNNASGQDYMSKRYKFKTPVNKILISDAILRAYPITEGRQILTVPKGKAVKLLGLYDGYYRAIYGNEIGFLHFIYIDGDENTFSQINYPAEGRIGYYDYEDESNEIIYYGKAALSISLRTEPSMTSEKVCTVPKSAVLKLTHHNSGYWLAEYQGYLGYMAKEFVSDAEKGFTDVDSYQKGLSKKAELEKREKVKAEAEIRKLLRSSTYSSSHYYIRGPRGGCYYINSNGNKTYVDRSLCS